MSSPLLVRFIVVALAVSTGAIAIGSAQRRGGLPEPLPPGETNEPFPQNIVSDADVVTVTLRDFATLPGVNETAARMM